MKWHRLTKTTNTEPLYHPIHLVKSFTQKPHQTVNRGAFPVLLTDFSPPYSVVLFIDISPQMQGRFITEDVPKKNSQIPPFFCKVQLTNVRHD